MKHRKAKKYGVAIAAAAIFAAVCIVCDSKYNIQVTRHELEYEKLPPEFDGFRIVHITDLHGSEFGRDNLRLIDMVARQEPDLIALTGDLAENPGQLESVDSLLRGISQLAPIYYVNGNHEWAGHFTDEIRALMDSYGVHCLSNEYEPLELEGAKILIAGAEDPNGRADMLAPTELADEIRRQFPQDFVLWLGHRNYWVERYPNLPVDLILSGHAHGGIVRLPFIGGLFSTKHSFGAEYETGLYFSGSYCMEVSRGLGNSIPVPRVFNRPELVTIVLKSGQKEQA